MKAELTRTDVDYFAESGYVVRGVVHVGANDGEELLLYISKGFSPIIAFEPHPKAYNRLINKFEGDAQVYCVNVALGNSESVLNMWVPKDGDDEKTSALKPIPTEGHDWTFIPQGEQIEVLCNRFDAWRDRIRFDLAPYNTLVVDAQGMELHVLEGFGRYLQHFELISVELSEKPVYEGEPTAKQVVEFLNIEGYRRMNEVQEHDDVYFVKSALLP